MTETENTQYTVRQILTIASNLIQASELVSGEQVLELDLQDNITVEQLVTALETAGAEVTVHDEMTGDRTYKLQGKEQTMVLDIHHNAGEFLYFKDNTQESEPEQKHVIKPEVKEEMTELINTLRQNGGKAVCTTTKHKNKLMSLFRGYRAKYKETEKAEIYSIQGKTGTLELHINNSGCWVILVDKDTVEEVMDKTQAKEILVTMVELVQQEQLNTGKESFDYEEFKEVVSVDRFIEALEVLSLKNEDESELGDFNCTVKGSSGELFFSSHHVAGDYITFTAA